jgi:hypothetical protein
MREEVGPPRRFTEGAVGNLGGGRKPSHFVRIYGKAARPSISPDHLLRAQLLQTLYSVRGGRLLIASAATEYRKGPLTFRGR